MKKRIIVIGFLASCTCIRAQTVPEWTQQDQTKIRYLAEQIAALRTYAGMVNSGFSIAKEGLTAIGKIRKADLGLHDGYLASIKTVNPKIKAYWKVAGIIALQTQILKFTKSRKRIAQDSRQFSSSEAEYYETVLTALSDGCGDLTMILGTLTSDAGFELNDSERIRRIDELHEAMQERFTFIKAFTEETNALALQRKKEKADGNTTRLLYNQH